MLSTATFPLVRMPKVASASRRSLRRDSRTSVLASSSINSRFVSPLVKSISLALSHAAAAHLFSCVIPVSPCTTRRRLVCQDDLDGLVLDDELPRSLADLDNDELDQLESLLEDRLESLRPSVSSDTALQAHGSAVTALAWLNDTTLLSAGMDKTVCFVQIDDAGDTGDTGDKGTKSMKVAKRIILSGGPAHSVLPSSSGVIMGLHSKSLLELVSPPSSAFLQDMQYSVLESNLCGWPRDLASNGTSLFSASCNEIRQFDTSTKKSKVYKLDKGDILSLVCTKDRLFAGTVDGSLFGFAINPKTGALELRDARPKAHGGRVTDLHIDRGMLVSSSYDGTVKSWCLDGLEIVAISSSRNGARVLAIAQAQNAGNSEEGGYLYAAGSDGRIRVLDPIILEERRVIVPPGLEEDEGIRQVACRGGTLVVATSAGRLICTQC